MKNNVRSINLLHYFDQNFFKSSYVYHGESGELILLTGKRKLILSTTRNIEFNPHCRCFLELDFSIDSNSRGNTHFIEVTFYRSGDVLFSRRFYSSSKIDLLNDFSFKKKEHLFFTITIPRGATYRIKSFLLTEERLQKNPFARGNTKNLSVVIVTYNKYEYVKNLLESLLYIDTCGYNLSIVVVDNHSEDNTRFKLRNEFKDSITVIDTGENKGGSGGFIEGIRYVSEHHDSEFIWLLDNDVVVEKSTLVYLLETLHASDSTGAVGSAMIMLDNPFMINETGAFVDWYNFRLYLVSHKKHIENLPRDPFPVDYCAAASLLVRKTVPSDIGLWKDIFIHFDDVEWCLRMQKNGWRVLCDPRSRIWHESANTKPLNWIRYYDIRNFLLLYDEYRPAFKKRILKKLKKKKKYFTMHGFPLAAKIIKTAVRDNKKKNYAKKTMVSEEHVSMDRIDFSLHNKRCFVFTSLKDFYKAIRKIPMIIFNSQVVLIYDNNPAYKKSRKTAFNKKIKSLPYMKMIFKGKRLGILKILIYHVLYRIKGDWHFYIDGNFEHKFVFPPFKKSTYIYYRYNTAVIQGDNRKK